MTDAERKLWFACVIGASPISSFAGSSPALHRRFRCFSARRCRRWRQHAESEYDEQRDRWRRQRFSSNGSGTTMAEQHRRVLIVLLELLHDARELRP